MIVILDHDENILEFMDDGDANIEITDTYGGYKSLDFDCELTNVKKDQYLFKQGNKLFLDNILFVINTEIEVDYVGNLIHLEAEELVYELNNCGPFYIHDPIYRQYVSGKTIKISVNMLNFLFNGFYTVGRTDLSEITIDKKLVTVQGTITKYNLLKEIEKATGLMFKYDYSLENNKIIKKVHLLFPEKYGVTHSQLLERVTVGENTNTLEYSSDETNNALGVMPIIKSEDNSSVDYTKILKQFYDLDINNEKVMPYYANYSVLEEDLLLAAKTLHEKITTFGIIPDTIDMRFDDDEIIPVGMSQFVDMATRYMINSSDLIHLTVVEPPEITNGDSLSCVFEETEINNLAYTVQDYIKKSGHVNTTISTKYGRISFQWLIYIFAEFLTTKKKVVCISEDYPNITKILPSEVQYDVKYVIDSKDYEYMPFMYTQNTSESNNIPYMVPMNPPDTDNHYYDVTKYISESSPVMVITKSAGAEQVIVTLTKKNISQETAEMFFIGFKDVNLIQDNSDIEIDFSKKEVKFMKFFEWIEEKEIEVTETIENGDTITVSMYPTCACCGGTVPYKPYTKTWENYCPACGKHNTLTDTPKGTVDGELTCDMRLGGCDADYCGYCGGDKWGYPRCRNNKLTPADPTTEETRTETIQEVHQDYKEVIANNDNTGDDETQIRLSDALTENSKIDALHGNISIKIQGATLKSLKCDSTKLYEMSPFPYVKRKEDMFIYASVTAANFNYTHMTNDNPKLEPFETSEQSIEEVLIGCWKKLNGSGDNKNWLEKSEDIDVDLTEENLDLNAGDFVYIKLPDTSVFKAQITEKKYNPKIRSDSKLKIGNVSREAIK